MVTILLNTLSADAMKKFNPKTPAVSADIAFPISGSLKFTGPTLNWLIQMQSIKNIPLIPPPHLLPYILKKMPGNTKFHNLKKKSKWCPKEENQQNVTKISSFLMVARIQQQAKFQCIRLCVLNKMPWSPQYNQFHEVKEMLKLGTQQRWN